MAGRGLELALAPGDAPYAAEAAERTARAHPGASVEILGTRVVIAAEELDAALHCWRVALLNERLVAAAAPARRALLAELIA